MPGPEPRLGAASRTGALAALTVVALAWVSLVAGAWTGIITEAPSGGGGLRVTVELSTPGFALVVPLNDRMEWYPVSIVRNTSVVAFYDGNNWILSMRVTFQANESLAPGDWRVADVEVYYNGNTSLAHVVATVEVPPELLMSVMPLHYIADNVIVNVTYLDGGARALYRLTAELAIPSYAAGAPPTSYPMPAGRIDVVEPTTVEAATGLAWGADGSPRGLWPLYQEWAYNYTAYASLVAGYLLYLQDNIVTPEAFNHTRAILGLARALRAAGLPLGSPQSIAAETAAQLALRPPPPLAGEYSGVPIWRLSIHRLAEQLPRPLRAPPGHTSSALRPTLDVTPDLALEIYELAANASSGGPIEPLKEAIAEALTVENVSEPYSTLSGALTQAFLLEAPLSQWNDSIMYRLGSLDGARWLPLVSLSRLPLEGLSIAVVKPSPELASLLAGALGGEPAYLLLVLVSLEHVPGAEGCPDCVIHLTLTLDGPRGLFLEEPSIAEPGEGQCVMMGDLMLNAIADSLGAALLQGNYSLARGGIERAIYSFYYNACGLPAAEALLYWETVFPRARL